jgi:ankyrin repeat protein
MTESLPLKFNKFEESPNNSGCLDEKIKYSCESIEYCYKMLEEGEKNLNIDEKLIFKIKNRGTLEEIKDLIEKGADLKFRDKFGDTPLLALRCGAYCDHFTNREKEILKILLEEKVDMYETDKFGENIFTIYIMACNVEIFEILLDPSLTHDEIFIDKLIDRCEKEKELKYYPEYKVKYDEIIKLLEEYKKKKFNL